MITPKNGLNMTELLTKQEVASDILPDSAESYINDPLFEKIVDNFNDYNKSLLITASTFSEDVRDSAYMITNNVNSNELEEKVSVLFNYFQTAKEIASDSYQLQAELSNLFNSIINENNKNFI